jgi:hypothetical protein
LAAAKAETLWNKAIKDRIFKKEVELLTVIYIPDFGKAAIFFLSELQKDYSCFMVRLNATGFEDLRGRHRRGRRRRSAGAVTVGTFPRKPSLE